MTGCPVVGSGIGGGTEDPLGDSQVPDGVETEAVAGLGTGVGGGTGDPLGDSQVPDGVDTEVIAGLAVVVIDDDTAVEGTSLFRGDVVALVGSGLAVTMILESPYCLTENFKIKTLYWYTFCTHCNLMLGK